MTKRKEKAKKPDDKKITILREAKALLRRELLAIPGVHGIGIGYKKTAGKKTSTLAIVVRVYKKLPKSVLDPKHIISERVRFYSKTLKKNTYVFTDVQERPKPVKYPHIATDLESNVRPVPGGFSISGAEGGTLGGWVWDNITDQVVLISNEHVLGSTPGTNVLQPSFTDGGTAADHFADVLRSGTLDAAIAEPIDEDDVELEIEGVGLAVYEVTNATLDMVVEKTGQTTKHTIGEVVLIDYESNHYGSTSDIEIETSSPGTRFAWYGDSGSLIVERVHPEGEEWKRIVGLLWGGDPTEENAYAHHIGDVFADLNLTTVCAGIIQNILDSIFTESYGETAISLSIRPSVITRFKQAKPFHFGISRDIEKRLRQGPLGKTAVKIVRSQRAKIVGLLRNRDGHRALIAALAPIVKGCTTTDDVFRHTFTKQDAERVNKFFDVSIRISPDLSPTIKTAKKLLSNIEGRNLSTFLSQSMLKVKP
jgi:hypothetical protein